MGCPSRRRRRPCFSARPPSGRPAGDHHRHHHLLHLHLLLLLLLLLPALCALFAPSYPCRRTRPSPSQARARALATALGIIPPPLSRPVAAEEGEATLPPSDDNPVACRRPPKSPLLDHRRRPFAIPSPSQRPPLPFRRPREGLERQALRAFAWEIPPLSSAYDDGDGGRVGVVGGSASPRGNLGAAGLVSLAALSAGADEVHAFVPAEAVGLLAAGPDVVVHAVDAVGAGNLTAIAALVMRPFEGLIKELDVLVVGPGVGTEEFMLAVCQWCCRKAAEHRIPVVLEDSLVASLSPRGLSMPPNSVVVFGPGPSPLHMADRLEGTSAAKGERGNPVVEQLDSASRSLNAVVVKQGKPDVVSHGEPAKTLFCSRPSSPKRGQGQQLILLGTVGTHLAWHRRWALKSSTQSPSEGQCTPRMDIEDGRGTDSDLETLTCAVYYSCALLREASALAFAEHRRSLVPSAVLSRLKDAEINLALESREDGAPTSYDDNSQGMYPREKQLEIKTLKHDSAEFLQFSPSEKRAEIQALLDEAEHIRKETESMIADGKEFISAPQQDLRHSDSESRHFGSNEKSVGSGAHPPNNLSLDERVKMAYRAQEQFSKTGSHSESRHFGSNEKSVGSSAQPPNNFSLEELMKMSNRAQGQFSKTGSQPPTQPRQDRIHDLDLNSELPMELAPSQSHRLPKFAVPLNIRQNTSAMPTVQGRSFHKRPQPSWSPNNPQMPRNFKPEDISKLVNNKMADQISKLTKDLSDFEDDFNPDPADLLKFSMAEIENSIRTNSSDTKLAELLSMQEHAKL